MNTTVFPIQQNDKDLLEYVVKILLSFSNCYFWS